MARNPEGEETRLLSQNSLPINAVEFSITVCIC